MAVIIHPLRFFNNTSLAKNLMERNPGTVMDATLPPGRLIPDCVTCNSGSGVVYEVKEETKEYRYRCILCGTQSEWCKDDDNMAQQWADMNGRDDDPDDLIN